MTTYLAQANTGSDSLASTKTVTKPAPVTSGAVGVFWLVRWHESGSFPAVTPPGGAVLRGTITTASMQTQCYLHRAAAETSFTYSWTNGRWSTLAAVWFSGVDPDADLATVPFQSATGSGTAIGTLTVTSNVDSALAWHVNTIDTSGVTHTPPDGFTEVADVSPWASAYRITVASGSQDASGATASPTTAWAAGLVALPPAPTGSVTGDATLTSTAGLTAAGTCGRTGGAELAGTAGLDAAGQTTVTGNAVLDAQADLAATARRDTGGGASLTGVAGLAASGLIDHPGQSTLTATADLEAVGLRATTATAGLVGTAALTAGGVVGSPPVTGFGVLDATAVLAAAGATAVTSSVGLAVTAALTASGTTSGSSDDIEVTVGAPYSPWTAGPPQASAWAAGSPQLSSWEVEAPW